MLLFVSPAVNACQKGFKPTDVAGVCVEVDQNEVNPSWVSSEKPPKSGMPSWQAAGTVLVNAPSMADSDAKADAEKVNADKEGKRTAGIK